MSAAAFAGTGCDTICTLHEHIQTYLQQGIYPFHMPGHKRSAAFFPWPHVPDGPQTWDMTEFGNMDNLHTPAGVLLAMQRRIADIYQADESRFLVNGASAGIVAAICAACTDGEPIAVARNCHRSVYNGLVMSGAIPVYISPAYTDDALAGGLSAQAAADCLEAHPRIKTLILTSPTYEGFVSDIATIAEAVHRRNGVLIVDEAHGAHFPFHHVFPRTALSMGADITINSFHKTLPALSQSAVLHMAEANRFDKERLRFFIQCTQTSSPSYMLMAATDYMLSRLQAQPEHFIQYVERLMQLRDALTAYLRGGTPLRLSGPERVGRNAIVAVDAGKLLFTCLNPVADRTIVMDGKKAADILAAQFQVQVEMAEGNHFLAMTSPADTAAGMERLYTAIIGLVNRVTGDRIERVDGRSAPSDMAKKTFSLSLPPVEVVIPPRQAVRGAKATIRISDSVGKVSGAFIMAYPPGIPLLAPGERITAAIVETATARGLIGDTITVLKDDH